MSLPFAVALQPGQQTVRQTTSPLIGSQLFMTAAW
jgi:hypothetical protein